ncbi:MAG: hypothetical protein K9H58_11055 [Bacteroidales bacterium]|nr:hypothetical protein [Bacteroidales bacterium]
MKIRVQTVVCTTIHRIRGLAGLKSMEMNDKIVIEINQGHPVNPDNQGSDSCLHQDSQDKRTSRIEINGNE